MGVDTSVFVAWFLWLLFAIGCSLLAAFSLLELMDAIFKSRGSQPTRR